MNCVYCTYVYTSEQCSQKFGILINTKLSNQKVPRNELEAIRIMAGTASTVKDALGERVAETVYVTDSTIAFCWCNYSQKKLKAYTLFQDPEICRNILS